MSGDDWNTVDDEADEWDGDWPADDDEASLTIPCPTCREEIYEEAEQCPYCGNYVVRTSTAWEGRPPWWILLGALGIVATIIALAAW